MITKRLVVARAAAATTVVSLAAFGLAGCGSDPTTTTSGSEGSGAASNPDLACPSGKLTGEGSTAQANAMTEVISMYSGACSNKATIEYNPTGSGAGIKQFNAGLVDFAGSDASLKTDEAAQAEKRCGGNPAWNLPMVVGPIAFGYNIEGVDTLVLTPEVLAKIFTGKITKWNDPAITALNSGASLPSANISVFFRSDESGTTENTERFLAAAGNGAWTAEPSKSWAGTGEGKNKTSGVAQAVSQTPNSISYMEWSYAKDNKLPTVQLDSGGGPVELNGESVSKALSQAEIKGSGNDIPLSIKYSDVGEGAYPALLVTYEIVCSKGLGAEQTAVLKDFLGYFASPDTQKSLEDLGYAPLPSELETKVTAAIQAIQ
jgi:phosphate transport system substrate-binding protein